MYNKGQHGHCFRKGSENNDINREKFFLYVRVLHIQEIDAHVNERMG